MHISQQVAHNVAATLQAARETHGVSYRRLEELSGINYMRLQRILKVETEMLVRELDTLAAALGLVGWEVLRDAQSAVDTEVIAFPAKTGFDALAAKDTPRRREETDQ